VHVQAGELLLIVEGLHKAEKFGQLVPFMRRAGEVLAKIRGGK
jgi:hypothetical protein